MAFARISNSVLLAFLMPLAAISVGCSDGSFTPTCCPGGSSSETALMPEAKDNTPIPTELAPLETIDADGYSDVLRRHRGEVVLVDFWASWCDPCMELFPHSVALHDRLAAEGLVVISVSLDDPDSGRTAAATFLAGQNATFDHFISVHGAGTESVEAFGLDGVLPELKLYDRQGDLRRHFGGANGPVDVDELDRAVAKLLDE